jgi:hypothetical protein
VGIHTNFFIEIRPCSIVAKVLYPSEAIIHGLGLPLTDPLYQYFFLGAYTILVYDHIMTLPEEVSHLLPGYVTLNDRWSTDSNCVEEEENIP